MVVVVSVAARSDASLAAVTRLFSRAMESPARSDASSLASSGTDADNDVDVDVDDVVVELLDGRGSTGEEAGATPRFARGCASCIANDRCVSCAGVPMTLAGPLGYIPF